MALDAFQSLLEIMGDIAEKNEEKQDAKFLSAFGSMAAEYLNKHGESAREWVKNHLMNMKEFNLDEPTAIRVVTHVANGHTSLVKDLLWADLVVHGMQRTPAETKARAVYANLLMLFLIKEANPDPKVITDVEKTQKALNMISHFALPGPVKQRLICPNCYRVIREWNAKTGIEDFGPSQIRCRQCSNVIPTQLIPWDKKSILSKAIVFVLPGSFILAGMIGLIVAYQELRCILASLLLIILPGSIWAYQSWLKQKESLTIPTW